VDGAEETLEHAALGEIDLTFVKPSASPSLNHLVQTRFLESSYDTKAEYPTRSLKSLGYGRRGGGPQASPFPQRIAHDGFRAGPFLTVESHLRVCCVVCCGGWSGR